MAAMVDLETVSVCLIRHGQSLAQGTPKQERRMEKYLDCACSPRGIAQAHALPGHIVLNGGLEGIELVISSPLKRALTTALLGFRDRRSVVIRSRMSQSIHILTDLDQVPIVVHPGVRELGTDIPENQARSLQDILKVGLLYRHPADNFLTFIVWFLCRSGQRIVRASSICRGGLQPPFAKLA